MLIEKSRFPIKETLFFGLWPSFFKIFLYRLRGYNVGKNVSIGFGSTISGEEVEIADGSSVGFFSFIRGKRIHIGKRVSIGSATMIDTPNFIIGEGSKINEQVFIGGLQNPDSSLTIGRNCQIMQMTFINPATSITIGDDTGIGGDCMLFGHTSWLSAFEGYPIEFKSIEIGNSVSIAWRVFISAGSAIGDGAVIGANSLVNRKIPKRCLATGSPAKVVAKAPYFPRSLENEEKLDIFNSIISELIVFMKGHGIECSRTNELVKVSHRKKTLFGTKHSQYLLRVNDQELGDSDPLRIEDPVQVFLSLKSIPESLRTKFVNAGTMWIDIETKEQSDWSNELGDEISHFIKRYGVRLNRV